MGIKYDKEPQLENPQMFACWPGLGNIGIITAEQLRNQPGTEVLGEIEPWDFFYPRKAIIRSGVLTQMDFPGSKLYFHKLEKNDLIIFIGDEQPSDDRSTYAGGKKALRMAGLILDAAEKFGCRRIYTSCAAISQTHHFAESKVWAASSRESLNEEMRRQKNTILMSEAEDHRQYSNIPGLNGLLLGLARKRGLDAVCLMGEIPDYLVQVQLPYPKASKAVLETLSCILKFEIDYDQINEMIEKVDGLIGEVYKQFPPELKERVEQRRSLFQAQTETITEQDEKWFKEHIDELFKKGGKDGK